MLSDQLWEKWIALQKKTFQLTDRKEFSLAIEGLNVFLEQQEPPDLRSEILGLRGDILLKQGDLQGAKQDFLAARDLSEPATYSRYVLELNIASVCTDLRDSDGAIFWYVKALETVADDPLTSGATAIHGLLDSKAENSLNLHEANLCDQAIRQAWRLFSLPGEPDLTNLQVTLGILDEAASHPLPMTQQDKS
jgi:hypothetical protein